MHRIGVVALGKIPEEAPKVIAAHISGYLGLAPEVLPPLKLPIYAYDAGRRQYDAGIILQEMEKWPEPGIEKVVAVARVDLFIPVFTHVFGEARKGGRAALMSLFRLGRPDDFPSKLPPEVLERGAKIALHELCHLYGLPHCTSTRCLMHFSSDVKELDRTSFQFCRYCAASFKSALARTHHRSR